MNPKDMPERNNVPIEATTTPEEAETKSDHALRATRALAEWYHHAKDISPDQTILFLTEARAQLDEIERVTEVDLVEHMRGGHAHIVNVHEATLSRARARRNEVKPNDDESPKQ